MKFDYTYRTRENELKTGSDFASSRDGLYRKLKAKGINPSRVQLSPGFLNYLSSFGKRGWGLIVLAVLCVVLLIGLTRKEPPRVQPTEAVEDDLCRDLKARGLGQEEIDTYLKERNEFHESYRGQLAERVAQGKMTREAANELLKAVGIRPLEAPAPSKAER